MADRFCNAGEIKSVANANYKGLYKIMIRQFVRNIKFSKINQSKYYPKIIYGIITLFLIIHWVTNYHNLHNLSNMVDIRKGEIEFLIVFVFVLQTIFNNKTFRILLMSIVIGVIFFLIYDLVSYFINEISLDYKHQNYYHLKIILFLIRTIIGSALFLLIYKLRKKQT